MKKFEQFKNRFTELYNDGKTVEESTRILNIPSWKGYEWKQELGLHVEKWQRVGMPNEFSKKTLEALLGTLLGDGYLEHCGQNKYARFGVAHCPKQMPYLEWLRDLFSELKPYHILPASDRWGTRKFYTPPHPQLEYLFSVCYPNRSKQITQEWVDGLTPLSFALWYMDDGSIQQKGQVATIATCSFNQLSINLLLECLSKWGIEAGVRRYTKDKNYFRIFFSLENAIKFYELIKEYVPESMKYKFIRFQ